MGGSKSKTTIAGNHEDPKAYMLVEYCGGWGYMKHCKELQKQVEDLVPNKYQYHLISDAGTTGRFEVTLFANRYDIGNDPAAGTKIHSKAETK